ncbi:MAG: DUF4351 domain-containing protein, partial [Acidobacteria bacterium]|nr:DUF4351 domain-containing protein [Acidobacteriota bacterium]
NRVTQEDLSQAVTPLFASKKGEVMPTIAETLRKEGIQIGLRQGRQEGTTALTLRLLHKRFGTLDKRTQAQIKGLSLEQLEDLGEALLDFQAPQDLVKWLKAHHGKSS